MTFPRGIDKTRNTEPYQSLPDKYSYIEFHDHVPKIWYGVSLEMSLRNLNITLNWLFSDVVPSSNQKLKLLIRTSRHAARFTHLWPCVSFIHPWAYLCLIWNVYQFLFHVPINLPPSLFPTWHSISFINLLTLLLALNQSKVNVQQTAVETSAVKNKGCHIGSCKGLRAPDLCRKK